jgi:hypothetical protein
MWHEDRGKATFVDPEGQGSPVASYSSKEMENKIRF